MRRRRYIEAGLEALERLMGSYSKMCEGSGYGDELYQKYSPSSDRSIIEQDLKILSLLREKEVCIPSALCAHSAEDYNDTNEPQLSESEFASIREWLSRYSEEEV